LNDQTHEPGAGAQSPSDLRSFINLVVGDRYITQKLIGEGGWSAVYLAFDRVLHRDVALKLLHRPLAANPDNLQRFKREAMAASKLNHANIAAIYDYGVLPSGQPYIVMEHLVGESLSERIEKRTATSETEAIEIVFQVASALSHAHKNGILHRDIKPSNIFVLSDTDNGAATGTNVKLLDFGLAKLLDDDRFSTMTDSGVALGTPSYMSPEQIQRKKVDCRTDIYSLGCTLYELLTGVKPFQGSVMDCMHAHLLEDPPPMRNHSSTNGVSPAVENVVRQAMAKNPDRRISSADAFMEALSNACSRQVQPLQHLWWHVLYGLRRFRKVCIPIAASAAIVLVAYGAAPFFFSLIGVRTIEIDATKVDQSTLDAIVLKMATTSGKTGK
jgi:eukaryotic-like serine/threonine-protein kinase